MKLYFGSAVTTAVTLMIAGLLGFIGCTVWNRAAIQYWGRRSAFLLIFGLVVCCFAAARDGLDKTIQHAIDGSCAPGVRAHDGGLLWRGIDPSGGHCSAPGKDPAHPADLVLCHVRRGIAEDFDHGDQPDFIVNHKF